MKDDSSCTSCTSLSRREARRESRRDAILEVAARHFFERGFSDTTMSGIAAELGGSKGTLWSYYSSKELLFGDVLDRMTLDFREQLTVTLNLDEQIETALHNFCVKFISKIASPRSVRLHRLVLGETDRFPEMGQIFYERAPLRTRELIAAFLAEAMKRGKLREDDPVRAAYLLMALCMGQSHQKLLIGVIDDVSSEQIETEADYAVAMFLRAYG